MYSKYYFDFIKNNPEKPWNWGWLSKNPNITWDIVQANPKKPWDWGWLSENPNITWDIIQANPEKSWNWGWLSRNPNTTWDIVQANPEKPWNWGRLSANLMSLQKRIWAVKKIQEWWIEILYSPDSSYVVEKIQPRFEKLVSIFLGDG